MLMAGPGVLDLRCPWRGLTTVNGEIAATKSLSNISLYIILYLCSTTVQTCTKLPDLYDFILSEVNQIYVKFEVA